MGGGGGGIHIDADGVLKATSMRTAAKRASPNLSEQVARRTDLRRISLRQLDAQLRSVKETGGELPDELNFLAGLNKIEYVVVDKANRDILLAGPAEGWAYAADGRPVGVETKRPVIHLEDLAAAMRCVLNGRGAVDCSIDPTRDGLASVRKLVPENISNKQQADTFKKRVAADYGLQSVRTGGVPADSKFALTMIEADYRMKRLALGVEKFSGLHSHLDTLVSLAGTGSTTFNLARWWFTPNYRPVVASEDGTVYQIRGPALKLLNEEVMFDESGNRRGTGRSSEDWDRFSKSFTKQLPTMETKILAFADLHNLFDLMLAAGLIKHLGHADWFVDSAFVDESVYAMPKYPVAKKAEPVVGHDLSKNMQVRRYIFTFCYGGVSMDPGSILNSGGFAAASPDGLPNLLGAHSGNGNSSATVPGTAGKGTGNASKPGTAIAGSGSNDSKASESNAKGTAWWSDMDRPSKNG